MRYREAACGRFYPSAASRAACRAPFPDLSCLTRRWRGRLFTVFAPGIGGQRLAKVSGNQAAGEVMQR